MSIGTLETIAEQLTALNLNLHKVLKTNNEIAADPEADTEAEAAPKPAAKKAAAKKVASKKVASKKVAAKAKKGDDLSNITVFKKRLFEVGEASGLDDAMPQLKQYIKDAGYANSDEIEVSDREEFLAGAKVHFNASDETEDDDDDDFDI